MWLFVNNHSCFGYIQITTLNNKNTFGAPYDGRWLYNFEFVDDIMWCDHYYLKQYLHMKLSVFQHNYTKWIWNFCQILPAAISGGKMTKTTNNIHIIITEITFYCYFSWSLVRKATECFRYMVLCSCSIPNVKCYLILREKQLY